MKITVNILLVALALKPDLALLLPDLAEWVAKVLEFFHELGRFVWFGLRELLLPFFESLIHKWIEWNN